MTVFDQVRSELLRRLPPAETVRSDLVVTTDGLVLKNRHGALDMFQQVMVVNPHEIHTAIPKLAPTIPWPYNIEEPVRSVHLAMERDCLYAEPARCPLDAQVARTLFHYGEWRGHHPDLFSR